MRAMEISAGDNARKHPMLKAFLRKIDTCTFPSRIADPFEDDGADGIANV